MWRSIRNGKIKILLFTIGLCCLSTFLIAIQHYRLMPDASSSSLLSNISLLPNNNSVCLCPCMDQHIINNKSTATILFQNDNSTSELSNAIVNNRSFSEHKLWYQEKLMMDTEDFSLSKYDKTSKKILVWTHIWPGLPNPFCEDRKDWFRLYGCPVWQCEVVPWDESGTNLKESGINVEDFDAIVFHDPYWDGRSQVPAKRSSHQRYVYWTIEAPGFWVSVEKLAESSDFFNWTMTYRWDSDIVVPYGYTRYLTGAEIRSRKEVFTKRNYAEGKSKMVIWIASNCKARSGRNEYVQRLQDYISVDIYGSCGNLTCERGKQKDCREMMGRDYKFVIAFENSLCFDYVTEKMFYNVNFDIVPIVMDLHGNYDRFAPPKSYINVLDFPSVKELADYLKMLDKNDTLYNEYFQWKESYAMEYSLHQYELNIYEASARGYCGLCAKLHNPSEPVSIVKDLKKWWNDDATCKVITFPSSNNDTWQVENFHW